MESIGKRICELLQTIKGNGSFETSGIKKITSPGLHIKGMGEIGLPVSTSQIREMISHSHKAPFGKGSKTYTDITIRSVWEINADQFSFQNEDWEEFMAEIIINIKEGLGIEEKSVAASIYKLLIYEEGDFFLPHKDSEKEPGMFGTLIIGLPSIHAGGKLIIRFDGKEKTVDFSSPASNYKMPYAAFFADCDHEIKPITSGYRVCLVYNLIQSSSSQRLGFSQTSNQINQMTILLKSLSNCFTNKPKSILLDHQYTPANFSLDSLKHHDKPRAELIMEAAEKAGYFAELGLVTHYKMGDAEGAEYDYNYRSSYNKSNSKISGDGFMGEIYEEYTTIEHWSNGEMPSLGEVKVEKEDILADFELGEGIPIEEEEEGFTGNAGMTIEYWYHYGAIILWPKDKQPDILSAASVQVRLKWLEYYFQHWDNSDSNSTVLTKNIITQFKENELNPSGESSKADFSIVAVILSKLRDENFILEKCEALLTTVFLRIQLNSWTALLNNYDFRIFNSIFEDVINRNDVYYINHLLDILKSLSPSSFENFLKHHINHIPNYLENIQLAKLKETDRYFENENAIRKNTIIAILEKVLEFSLQKEQDENWIQSIINVLTKTLTRNYVNNVLVVVLKSNKGFLTKKLQQICIMDLTNRTVQKPLPLSDWKRNVPDTKNDQEIWDILRPFLASDVQVFEYRKSEVFRNHMAAAINRVTIDLKMETIKKGSPHILKITKTNAAYELRLKNWHEDKTILESLLKKN